MPMSQRSAPPERLHLPARAELCMAVSSCVDLPFRSNPLPPGTPPVLQSQSLQELGTRGNLICPQHRSTPLSQLQTPKIMHTYWHLFVNVPLVLFCSRTEGPYLVADVVGNIVGQLAEECMQDLWLGEGQALDVGVVLAGATLHNVGCQCERGAHKPVQPPTLAVSFPLCQLFFGLAS